MKRIRNNIATGISMIAVAIFMLRKNYFHIMRGLMTLGIYDKGWFTRLVHGHFTAVHPRFVSLIGKIRG